MRDDVEQLLRLLVEGFPRVELMDPLDARAAVAARARPWPDPAPLAAVEDEEIDVEGGRIRVRLYRPRSSVQPLPAVVFLHGGGFVMCSIESHDGFCREMACELEAMVVSVDYRMAPEHRAPTAALDALSAFRWVTGQALALGVDPGRVLVAGDSAGGNLAAVVAHQATADATPPAGQVLLYPVLDPSCDTPSHHAYAEGYFNTRAAMQWYWRQYLGDAPAQVPVELVAPTRSSRSDPLPPALVVTAGRDPLSDEGVEYAASLGRSGTRVRHRHYPELFHGFLTIPSLEAAVFARRLLWHDARALLNPITEDTPGALHDRFH